ncbi:MAG: hypothetical protein DHS20C16_02040 [Phycisphaerae bacterium]|nr:MAG: hypothetical protein DHS20C16_02040 [Phycisphaerae bacterium]
MLKLDVTGVGDSGKCRTPILKMGNFPFCGWGQGGCVVVKPQKGPRSGVSRRETQFVMGGAITSKEELTM